MKPFILIVDDEFGFADVVAGLLRERGYDVTIAIDGKVALDVLSTRVADLIITDMMMPIMDGPELLLELRADARFARIPVVLMTALPEGLASNTAPQFDAVLVKPFSFEQLQQVLDRLAPPPPRA